MNKAAQVNAVALHMQGVMGMLDDFYDALVGKGQHNIVLVVGAGDVSQYAANRDRALSIELLSGLLARWKVDLPDTLPDASTPGDTRGFELLLNEFERAVRKYGPGSAAYRDTRSELVGHVGRLIAQINRHGLDMHAAGETELARIWTKVEQIRAKQAAKPKHSPLPAAPADHEFKQPGWDHVMAAFIEGAREAKSNAEATDDDVRRAADAYTKRVHEEVDPETERRLRENDWPGAPAAWSIKGVRVDGETVIVAVKGGNDAARWLCGELLAIRHALILEQDLVPTPEPIDDAEKAKSTRIARAALGLPPEDAS